MRKVILSAAMMAVFAMPALAGEHATKPEAEAMVKKAVAFLKANGPEKAFPEFNKKDGKFVDRDLYVVVYDTKGTCLAHGSNPKLIGKDLIDAEDADGKAYVKERVTLAQSKPSFWQEYKFADPVTKKISPKETYCEHEGDNIVCAGIYK